MLRKWCGNLNNERLTRTSQLRCGMWLLTSHDVKEIASSYVFKGLWLDRINTLPRHRPSLCGRHGTYDTMALAWLWWHARDHGTMDGSHSNCNSASPMQFASARIQKPIELRWQSRKLILAQTCSKTGPKAEKNWQKLVAAFRARHPWKTHKFKLAKQRLKRQSQRLANPTMTEAWSDPSCAHLVLYRQMYDFAHPLSPKYGFTRDIFWKTESWRSLLLIISAVAFDTHFSWYSLLFTILAVDTHCSWLSLLLKFKAGSELPFW